MAGILYLFAAMILGGLLTKCLYSGGREKDPLSLWVFLPSAFGLGTLFLTWGVYIIAWCLYIYTDTFEPLTWANLAAAVVLVLFAGFMILRKRRKRISENKNDSEGQGFLSWIGRPDLAEVVFYSAVLVFLTWIFFYVFHVTDRRLCSGLTVFSDYAPHTAMIRSFSRMNNYPTQYPHFGGEDIRYHFLFQFLAGNLEYLGMRIDLAYNIISILSLEGFLMLLTSLVRKMGGRLPGMIFTVLFFLMRSGTAFFRFAGEHLSNHDLWETLMGNTSFIGYTANENWGLWNFNVYLNQRHLAFGLLIGTLAIWFFTDRVEAGSNQKIRTLLFSRSAWIPENLPAALLLGTAIGLTSFWNGAAVIGCLLILAVYALFSAGKLDYLALAVVAVLFSVLQTRIFTWGELVEPSFYFGFLADQKTVPGVIVYLFAISGFAVLGMAVVWIFFDRSRRAMIAAFCAPAVFAFFVSLTGDITVNHKYIMISFAFLAVIWARLIEKLLSRGLAAGLAAAVLILCLTVTGGYDFAMILRGNGSGRELSIDLQSDVTRWLDDHVSSEDLILSPLYSMSEVTLSGCCLYNGWPYYAWSAGYDTYYRGDIQRQIYTTEDPEILKELVLDEGITYIIYEDNMSLDGTPCREDIIRDTFPLVYESANLRIYEVEI